MSESLPQHVNSVSPNRTAHAPYNFVPLPERIITQKIEDLPDHDAYQAGRYTGYFEVTLETLTPLYTRAARRANSEDSQPSQFFYLHDENQPVIPGSSLRGMLRSLVEIVTFSKLSRLNASPKIFYRAVAAEKDDVFKAMYQQTMGKNGSNIRAGILRFKDGTWCIQPCPKIRGKAYEKIRDTRQLQEKLPSLIPFSSPGYRVQYHHVFYKIKNNNIEVMKPNSEITNGILVCTGNMSETSDERPSPRRCYALVAMPSNQQQQLKKIAREAIEAYIDALTPFIKKQLGEQGVLEEGRPVFYIPRQGNEDIYLFGHNPNFRLPIEINDENWKVASPVERLPEELRQDKPDEVDFAEAMFGYVRETGQQGTEEKAYAGRIFVTDARLKAGQSDIFEEELTPKILSSPKPTTFQHYLVQKSHEKSDLRHYGSKDTVLRGFKLYWRRKITGIQTVKEKEASPPANSTQHTRIRPVKAGKRFSFRVYFENLSEVELGALAWVLDLPQDCCHALGMAKPYGMGAVRLTPTLHLSNRQARYEHLFEGESWALGSSSADVNIYKKAFEEAFKEKTQEENQARWDILLTLLRFYQPDGPFDYMKEFRERKVLPTPEQVAGGLTVYQPPPSS